MVYAVIPRDEGIATYRTQEAILGRCVVDIVLGEGWHAGSCLQGEGRVRQRCLG